MVVVAASWTAVVELTPASARPFIGSTSSNSELSLDFGYNGFGRVGGSRAARGPRRTTRRTGSRRSCVPGVDVPRSALEQRYVAAHRSSPPHGRASRRRAPPRAAPRQVAAAGKPVAFASTHLSPVRIFGVGLGDQAGWVVPLAVLGRSRCCRCCAGASDRARPGCWPSAAGSSSSC